MRYHLFSYDGYYPSGADQDYRGSFDSPAEAQAFLDAQKYGYDVDVLMIQNAEGNLEVVEF